jgi:hypothetical protein
MTLTNVEFNESISLGSVISISPLSSMDCNGPGANFAKPLSNDFNRLGGKCPNRRLLVPKKGRSKWIARRLSEEKSIEK